MTDSRAGVRKMSLNYLVLKKKKKKKIKKKMEHVKEDKRI